MNKLILIFVILSTSLFGQIDKSTYYSYGESLYSDVIELPYDDPDSVRIAVLVKAANESLRFQKVRDGKYFGQYYSVLNVQVLFENEKGIVKNRKNILDTVYFKSYNATLSKTIFVENYSEFILVRDKYKLEIEFDIKENSYLNTKTHDLDYSETKKLFTPILLNTQNVDLFTETQPFILNQTIAFDAQGSKIIIPALNLEEGNYTYKLEKKKNLPDSPLQWDEKNEIAGSCDLLESVDFEFVSNYADLVFNLKRNRKYKALNIDIPGEKVLPGVYQLSISKNNEKIQDFEINIKWYNRPISVNRISYAIDMLSYIASERQVENLNDSDNQSADFLEFWKSKDPTPTTPFNEALQQYYERVDYAFFNYKTISESDGAKTDRGKIYILKSIPASVEEDFKEDKTLLRWKYPSLKTEYVFELIGAGDYRLVEINDI